MYSFLTKAHALCGASVLSTMARSSIVSSTRLLSVSQSPKFSGSLTAGLPAKKKPAKRQTPDQKALKDLKGKLASEKKTLKKLQEKYKATNDKINLKKKKEKAKVAASKAKQKQDKLLSAALKPYRRISAFNMYVKENKGPSLADASKAWTYLSEQEKAEYQEKANDYNEEQLQVYTPKPKAPSFGFARYLQENYVKDDRESSQIFKDLSAEWKKLTADEKKAYEKDERQWANYEKELKAWKDQRIKLFNQSSKSQITV